MTDEGTILSRLNAAQRDFILRMEPTLEPQDMTEADWDNVECGVDNVEGVWPWTLWFGGMRLAFQGEQTTITFRFNETGLRIRTKLMEDNNAEILS